MARYLAFVIVVGLVVWSVLDISRSSDEERLGVHPVLWMALVVLVPVLGAIVWILVSRGRRAAARQAGGASGGGSAPGGSTWTPRRRTGPVAPDDDPDFLRKLDEDRRRREQGTGDGSPTS
ncbi:PLDc N-terminal domain-containing protein [Cellulomonas fimi]|uniref:PLDc N-terminal domain-containing protein n=1 Tax=Cellulomonas fimi TaxID=1708 RepID=UPI00234C1C26|nr:PLDc N-terminal domain-containing protein [Cellulomonas fimi]MDC7122222.1 PLDc N-terminal domain-containing protein [Cellulomonas fimi]